MSRLLPILLVVNISVAPAWAQVNSAAVLGMVQDSTGAVLPGVEITATNVDTGITRTVVSDDTGNYHITNLGIGNYEVAATLPGFQTAVRSGIELTIGRNAQVNLTLTVGEITERVTVTGEAPLVETTSSSLGDLVDRQTVMELPLNGRDLTDLLTLGSGTSGASSSNTGTSQGFSSQVSISGARPNDAAVLLDGTETKGLDQGVPAGVSGNFIGAEAIQEFKIEKNAYSAQYGGASGGIINVVSKSGTNEFHGSVYEFHRNDNLDAADHRSSEKGEFKRNQFGFSIGGPVIKNRTFFFWNYEGLRERLGLTDSLRVPTVEARSGIVPGVDPADVDPVVLPFFEVFPLPAAGATDLGNGTTRQTIGLTRPTDEDFYQGRVDHQFTDSDSLFFRFTYQDSSRIRPEEIDRWKHEDFVINRFATLEYQHIFSPQLLNTFRFGFNRRGIGQDSFEDPITPDNLRFVPLSAWRAPLGADYVMGRINISGLDDVGLGRAWADRKTNSFEFMDNVAYNRGDHSIKIGATVRRIHLNGDNPSRPAGEWTFRSIRDFVRNIPNRFRGDVSPATDSVRGLRQSIFGWYVQDDWQMRPGLTLNLGLRHEFYTVPNEVNGKLANLRNPLTDSVVNVLGTQGDKWFENPSILSFMPRVGLAWDPTGEGKMAIRAGAGLFFNHIQPDTFRRAIFRTQPFALETQVRGSAITRGCDGGSCFPNIFDKIVNEGLGDPDLQIFPYDYQNNPHMLQWNLSIQRELLPGMAVQAGYVGNRGINIMHQVPLNTATANDVNGRLVFPDDAQLPNQAFPNLDLLSQEASTDSYYHAIQLGLQRRFSDGFQLQLSYTFSKTVDESSQINNAFDNNGGGVSYYHEPNLRRSLAAFHAAKVFAASGVWGLPFGNDLDGAAGAVLGGWQLGAIWKLADGPPVSITMESRGGPSDLGLGLETPDLATGSLSPVRGGPDQYFDPSGFVPPPTLLTIGNVGRNTLIAPGLNNFDFSLTKKTQVGETVTVEFRAEFYNLFNRPNLGLPSTSAVESLEYGSNGLLESFEIDPSAGFISPGDTTTKMREVQFGLRIVF